MGRMFPENRVCSFFSFICLCGGKVANMRSYLGMVGVVLAVSGWIIGSGFAYADTVTLTTSSDPIYGVYNTVAGGDSTAAIGAPTAQAGTYNPGESAASAIDGSLSTKYCIYNSSHSDVATGFYVTPSIGQSIVKSIQFATANDAPGRDPLTITLEGSNSTTNLTTGIAWTTIFTGGAGLDANPGRAAWGAAIAINNDAAFTSYRLLVTSVRDAVGGSHLTQFSEVKLCGNAVPEPCTYVLVVTGAMGVLAYAWRRRK